MFGSDSDLVRASTDAFDSVFDGSASAPSTMIGTVVSGDKFIKDAERLKWL